MTPKLKQLLCDLSQSVTPFKHRVPSAVKQQDLLLWSPVRRLYS